VHVLFFDGLRFPNVEVQIQCERQRDKGENSKSGQHHFSFRQWRVPLPDARTIASYAFSPVATLIFFRGAFAGFLYQRVTLSRKSNTFSEKTTRLPFARVDSGEISCQSATVCR
jgi:hypothetical protein